MGRWRRHLRIMAGGGAAALILTSCIGGPPSSPTALPSGPLLRFAAAARLPGSGQLVGAVRWKDAYFAAGALNERGVAGTAIWFSSDAANWVTIETGELLQEGEPVALLRTSDRLLLVTRRYGWGEDPGIATSNFFFSDDGRRWQAAVADDSGRFDQLEAAAAAGTGAVAVGEHADGTPAMWRTEDGRRWQPVSLGKPFAGGAGAGAHFRDAGAVDGRFLVAGEIGPFMNPDGTAGTGSSTPTIWTSSDGETWERATLEVASGEQATLHRLLVTPSGVLAEGNEALPAPRPFALWSADGERWSRTGSGSGAGGVDEPPWGISACSSVTCVVVNSARFLDRSFNPASSTPDPTDDADRMIAWRSTDGRHWETVPIVGNAPRLARPDGEFLGPVLQTILTAGDRFIAVGFDESAPVSWPFTVDPGG